MRQSVTNHYITESQTSGTTMRRITQYNTTVLSPENNCYATSVDNRSNK